LGAGKVWSGAEAVLMFNGDNSEANLGYGDYLVTAKLLTPPLTTWADLDPNVVFGLFTYERYGLPPSEDAPFPPRGGSYNPYREIDMAEITRWGWDHVGTCPFTGYDGKFPLATLCKGNAQFAVQDFSQSPLSVQRYDIGNIQVVTLVMNWHMGHQPVTFEKYNGAFTFQTLPTTPNYVWTTPSLLDNFIPSTTNPASCERFHINFWLGNSLDGDPHPPPRDGRAQEAVISNFEFRPWLGDAAKGDAAK
jgi:hypothetical protein